MITTILNYLPMMYLAFAAFIIWVVWQKCADGKTKPQTAWYITCAVLFSAALVFVVSNRLSWDNSTEHAKVTPRDTFQVETKPIENVILMPSKTPEERKENIDIILDRKQITDKLYD